MKFINADLLRFLTVGVGSNLLNFATYLLLYSIGAPLFVASAAGYAVGLLLSYHFGRIWVFGRKFEMEKSNLVRFLAVYAMGGIGMSLIIELMVKYFEWNHALSWVVGAGFAVINNYVGLKKLVFNKGLKE
ncbi:MAG: GtrA family protein [Pseudomonadota bacterium]